MNTPDSAAWRRTLPVRVDMTGIIGIMGKALYSRASTPIRELLQNAHDGITRVRNEEPGFEGTIRIRRDAEASTLSFEDDGVGLSEADAERFLVTLGSSLTALLKGEGLARRESALIGQFGIGLFSVFLIAKRVVLESKQEGQPAIAWESEGDDSIVLASSPRERRGTCVTLWLRDDAQAWASDENSLREAVKEYADFLSVPIFLDEERTRCNRVQAAWLDPSVEREFLEIELEELFGERALGCVPVCGEGRQAHRGVLYFSPERTPGFTSQAALTVTMGRMVIGRDVRDLLPVWASFVRGIVEAGACSPVASREDLMRDEAFSALRDALEGQLFLHLEGLAETDIEGLRSLVSWQRYAISGAALRQPRLRRLLRRAYSWRTSAGLLSFEEIVERSPADVLHEMECDSVLWFHSNSQQERWAEGLFADLDGLCVHAVRTFEESLLAALVADLRAEGAAVDLRPIDLEAEGFANSVLGVSEVEELDEAWQEFLGVEGALVTQGRVPGEEPVLVILDKRLHMRRSLSELKRAGALPPGFQRLIDRHLEGAARSRHQILLNARSQLVSRCLSESPAHPFASVLRLQVLTSFEAAGAPLDRATRQLKSQDLAWIAETLWTRREDPPRES